MTRTYGDPMTDPTLIRPMRAEDVVACEQLWSPPRATAWIRRTEHLVRTDPGGCWVAERDGDLLGFATSLRRDLTWALATYVVRPDLQGLGLGTALLTAALKHSEGTLRAMVSALDDPRALRSYHRAGFELHPQVVLTGRVDRSGIPATGRVREGGPEDFELMDSVDRRVRDAAHGVDHALLIELHRLVVIDAGTGSGYAYLDEESQPVLLAATNRRTATRLLWEAIAGAAPDADFTISHVTGANQWAITAGDGRRSEPAGARLPRAPVDGPAGAVPPPRLPALTSLLLHRN